jgi:hypothetical protein
MSSHHAGHDAHDAANDLAYTLNQLTGKDIKNAFGSSFDYTTNKAGRLIGKVIPETVNAQTKINNFGFGGTNAHIVLAKGNYTFERQEKDDIVKVFARTRKECEHLLHDDTVRSPFFESCGDKNKFPYFGARIQDDNGNFFINERKSEPKLVYVYSGQGSNYLNMGKELYFNNTLFQETIQIFPFAWLAQ